LLIEEQLKQCRVLNDWFRTPLGQFVSKEFTDQLKFYNAQLKGDSLLQLGYCGDSHWLKELDYKNKWVASPFSANSSVQIETSLNQLPINRNSLDCIVIPLTLELFGNNSSLIDELDRVLKPMGFVVLLSLNPFSLWGGALKCGLLRSYNDKRVKMRTPFQINRLFTQMGYRQCCLNNFCYIPPVNNESIIKKLIFLDEIGKMIWPFPSGFYCYIAQKYERITPGLTVAVTKDVLSKSYETPFQPASN
jgi:hypothetical protein